MIYTCAECQVLECSKLEKKNLPINCPMREEDTMNSARAGYEVPEIKEFYVESSEIEALGFCEWVRLREIMEFSRKMGYKILGLAFCKGLKNEAHITSNILRKNGFKVASVICKTGGYDKSSIGIKHKLHEGEFEPMCNPIGQAKFLEKAGTQFNIVLGLCVGHDSVFFQHTHVPATVFAVKDRVLAHNPIAILNISDSYRKKRIENIEG